MFDVSGKCVYRGLATGKQFLLPTLQHGIYITKIKTDKKTITLKETIF